VKSQAGGLRFLATFTWLWAPTQWARYLAQVFFLFSDIIRVFKALGRLSSISVAIMMAQKPKSGRTCKPINATLGILHPFDFGSGFAPALN